jgi:hypothetical protein
MSLEPEHSGGEPTDDGTAEIRKRTRGGILIPGDDGYDEARTIWNGMIDKRPALIVRCTGTGDVVAAVDFTRENDIFGLLEQLGELGETPPSVL